jgi:hypothetical protein
MFSRQPLDVLPQWRSSAVLGSYWWRRNGVSTYSILTAILITSIAIFFFSTLRDGHKWDGDEALYIMNARNIVERRPYGDVGFIPQRNVISPASYPPGLPLLLAPVYFFSGLDFQQMKKVCVASFILFLLIFARITRQSLPPAIALALIALVGLNPYFFSHFKDTIRSEPPFLLFCYAALHLVDGLKYQHGSSKTWAIPAAGMALALAYSTRTIGIVLFPSIFLISLYKSRRLINPGTLVLAIGMSAIILMTFLFPSDPGSYMKLFADNFSIDALLKHVFAYKAAINNLLFAASLSQKTQSTPIFLFLLLLLLSILLLVFWGFIVRIRAGLSIFEVFTVTYVVSMIIYPIDLEPSRYLAPLCPLLLFYAFYGAYTLGSSLGNTAQISLPAILFSTFAILYTINYANADFGPIPSSMTDPSSHELFNAIKSNLPVDAVLLARKPTIITLFTDRRAALSPASFTDDELWRYMHDIKASYIVQDLPEFGLPVDQPDEFNAFLDRNHAALSLIFSNRWFNMYRVTASQPRGE